jgi:hypothetical protein
MVIMKKRSVYRDMKSSDTDSLEKQQHRLLRQNRIERDHIAFTPHETNEEFKMSRHIC